MASWPRPNMAYPTFCTYPSLVQVDKRSVAFRYARGTDLRTVLCIVIVVN